MVLPRNDTDASRLLPGDTEWGAQEGAKAPAGSLRCVASTRSSYEESR